MYFHHKLNFLAFAFALLSSLSANAHCCSDKFKAEVAKFKITQYCRLKILGAEFAWNFNTNSRELEIAFGARLESETGWLAWGLNPQGPHMVGTQALIGIKGLNHSLEQNKYSITYLAKIGCPILPSDDVELNVTKFRFDYWAEIGYHVILATIFLPHEYNSSRTNMVWQIGDAAAGRHPLMHPKTINNLDSAETVDLVSNKVISYTAHFHRRMRTVHGILNIVGWGLLLPMGVIVARYFRKFPKEWARWYAYHVSCQTAGYITGSSGWALGIWLGTNSKYYCFRTHRNLGIIIFTFTTIQMLALRLKPKRSDEYRIYWNMYHHFLGYALLALISVNIFVGINILHPDHTWKWTYIGLLGSLGALALAFELFTWIKFLKDRKKKRQTKHNAATSSI